MSKLAEQLQQKMPAMADGARLATAATEALRKAGRNPMTAHDGFTEKVVADPTLVIALVGRSEISRLALNYLQRVRADMVRGGAAARMDGEAGQGNSGAHGVRAPSPSAGLPGQGHPSIDAQKGDAQPRQSLEGGGSQNADDAQCPVASPPSPQDSGGGYRAIEYQDGVAPDAVAPKELSASAIAARGASAKVIALTILDTHRLSNGVAIGDVYWGSLHRLRSASARDTALLRQLINIGVGDPHKKVRDIVSVEQMQLMIQKAAEIVDAM